MAEAGGVEGVFSLFAMVHTMDYSDAEGDHASVPWDGSLKPGGPFVYASMPCSGQAPVNNLSTDLPALGTTLPDSRVPVSTRNHPFRFDVVEDADEVRLHGGITLAICHLRSGPTADPDPVPDADKERIYVTWDAEVVEVATEVATWRGAFTIVGGSGPYRALQGEGEIGGYFFCFAPEGRAGLGRFTEAQYCMIGDYRVAASDR